MAAWTWSSEESSSPLVHQVAFFLDTRFEEPLMLVAQKLSSRLPTCYAVSLLLTAWWRCRCVEFRSLLRRVPALGGAPLTLPAFSWLPPATPSLRRLLCRLLSPAAGALACSSLWRIRAFSLWKPHWVSVTSSDYSLSTRLLFWPHRWSCMYFVELLFDTLMSCYPGISCPLVLDSVKMIQPS